MAAIWAIGVLGLGLLALSLWRFGDRRRDVRVWQRLVEQATQAGGGRFDAAMLDGLPEPAQRYFLYVIRPGTELRYAAEITMAGEMGLGDKARPGYKPMQARQILAPPFGLVWQVRNGALRGSDGACDGSSWTRFWMFGLVPVVRVGDTPDHLRASLGRVVAEAAFWVPASLLPAAHVKWEPVGPDTARAIVTHLGLEQAVDITVQKNGQPTHVVIQRWSNVNPDHVFRLQPFGGTLDDFRDVEGYRLPFSVDGGNHFGTPDYFPFFKARVTDIRFPRG